MGHDHNNKIKKYWKKKTIAHYSKTKLFKQSNIRKHKKTLKNQMGHDQNKKKIFKKKKDQNWRV